MDQFNLKLDLFDPHWLQQLSHSPLDSGFTSFLNEDCFSFCPCCRRFPSSAADDYDHHLRQLSALSLLRNRRPAALNPARPPPPAGLYLQRLKAAAAATVRENNHSAASAYPRLPRVSALGGFSGGGAPSPSPPPRPAPREKQLRSLKVVSGHSAAARSSEPLHEVHTRKAYQQSGGGYSSSRGNYPESIRAGGGGSGGGAVPVQKLKTRPVQSRVLPFQGTRSGLPRAGNLGSRESSAGTGVFIPLAPPDSDVAVESFKSKLLISGKQRSRVSLQAGGRAAAAAGGGEGVVTGGKHSSAKEGGKKTRRFSVEKGGDGDGEGEEEDCHYHLPPDLMGLPKEWTYELI